MERDEIIKALDVCANPNVTCSACPLDECKQGELEHLAIALIKELTEENERLRGCVKSKEEIEAIMRATYEQLVRTIAKEQIDKAVADTVRKMQELVRKKIKKTDWLNGRAVYVEIDQIAKKMLEGTDEKT